MNIYQAKLTLQGVAPPIWRRVQVSANMTLGCLHEVVQKVMGWKDKRQHLFIVGGKEYGATNPDFGTTIGNEREAVLGQIAGQGDRFIYVYDFGDEWEHEILIECVLSAKETRRLPCCLDGERACPPENCGGPKVYAQILAGLADTGARKEARILDQYSVRFDPNAFSLENANARLEQLK